jgi:predicted dehydrogenase
MGLTHAKAWHALGDRAAVACVASRTPVDWAAAFGASQTADIDEAITRPDVDIVDICLPTLLHARIAERALDAGKHVLCEKPMALDMQSADIMVEAARRAPGALMIAQVVRFFPAYMKIREIVESGRIGSAVSVSAHRLAAGSRDIAWLRDTGQSGGVAVDLLVHDYDQANLLLGTPRTVYAQEHGAEGVNVIISYPGGKVSAVEGNTAMPAGFPFTTGIRVYCEGGVVEHVSDGRESMVTVREAGASPWLIPVEQADPYATQARYFLDRLDDGLPIVEGSPEQGRTATAVAIAALASARSGRPETL